MKKSNICKSTIDRYRELEYSEKTVECLHYLESRCENLGDFLEEYRHLQSDGRLFHESLLGIIRELHGLREALYEQDDKIMQLQQQVGPVPETSVVWDEVDPF